MRKSTKLAILVAALVALCSIAALAADTWKQEGENWYCYDKDNNMIYGEAKKSGNNYYYLDEATGAMVKNKLVDNGDGKYYYGEDGARVVGAWAKVEVENDGDGWEYMYFRTVTGKAYTSADCAENFKNINGKKYYFNGDGYMVYGYVDATYTAVDNCSEAAYNFGAKTDGSAQTGWVNVKDGADANYEDSASIWFYFKNGKKIADEIQFKVASGKKYNFGSDGKLVTGWAVGTASDDSKSVASASYYGGADEGALVKKQWIKTDHFTKEDDTKWYYLDGDGKVQGPGVAKINGKFYLFNTDRQMVSGVVAIVAPDALDPKSAQAATIETFSTLSAFKKYDAPATGKKIMFFSGDADTDGSLKIGTQTITIDGDSATVVFDKHGFALEGISSKKIYVNGILQAAGDDKVAVKKLRVPTSDYAAEYYLVNAAGSILKNTKQMNADGIYYVAKGEYDEATDTYAIFKFADKPYASNAATAVLKGEASFKVGSEEYAVSFGPETNGVTAVDWAKK